MDTYAHLLPEANNQAAVKLARILGGNPESFNRTIEIKSGAVDENSSARTLHDQFGTRIGTRSCGLGNQTSARL